MAIITTDDILELRERLAIAKPLCVGNEQATKMAMTNPTLELLGYDPTDVTQVYPEYDTRGWGKADYAILVDGAPAMIVECKAVTESLHHPFWLNQLRRYYNALPVSVGALTNGEAWRLYGERESDGEMGGSYVEINLLADKPQDLAPTLAAYTAGAIRELASPKDAEAFQTKLRPHPPQGDDHYHVWFAPNNGRRRVTTLRMDPQPHYSRGAARKAIRRREPLYATVMACREDSATCVHIWDGTAKRRGWLQCGACGRWNETAQTEALHLRLHCPKTA